MDDLTRLIQQKMSQNYYCDLRRLLQQIDPAAINQSLAIFLRFYATNWQQKYQLVCFITLKIQDLKVCSLCCSSDITKGTIVSNLTGQKVQFEKSQIEQIQLVGIIDSKHKNDLIKIKQEGRPKQKKYASKLVSSISFIPKSEQSLKKPLKSSQLAKLPLKPPQPLKKKQNKTQLQEKVEKLQNVKHERITYQVNIFSEQRRKQIPSQPQIKLQNKNQRDTQAKKWQKILLLDSNSESEDYLFHQSKQSKTVKAKIAQDYQQKLNRQMASKRSSQKIKQNKGSAHKSSQPSSNSKDKKSSSLGLKNSKTASFGSKPGQNIPTKANKSKKQQNAADLQSQSQWMNKWMGGSK